ncbi:MAG: hypothetical protein AAB855_04155 [Patescibacteria group bacterium]
MTSSDLFLLIATLAIIFITAFLCTALYWFIRIVRVWQRMSEQAEQSMHVCFDRVDQALHAVTSFKAVADIAMQTLQTAMAVYTKRTDKRKSKKQSKNEEE